MLVALCTGCQSDRNTKHDPSATLGFLTEILGNSHRGNPAAFIHCTWHVSGSPAIWSSWLDQLGSWLLPMTHACFSLQEFCPCGSQCSNTQFTKRLYAGLEQVHAVGISLSLSSNDSVMLKGTLTRNSTVTWMPRAYILEWESLRYWRLTAECSPSSGWRYLMEITSCIHATNSEINFASFFCRKELDRKVLDSSQSRTWKQANL